MFGYPNTYFLIDRCCHAAETDGSQPAGDQPDPVAPDTTSLPTADDVIEFNVAGARCSTTRQTLTAAGGAMAGLAQAPPPSSWLSGPRWKQRFIETEPAVFRHVLGFLRHGRIPDGLPPTMLTRLETEARLLDVPALGNEVERHHLQSKFADEIDRAMIEDAPRETVRSVAWQLGALMQKAGRCEASFDAFTQLAVHDLDGEVLSKDEAKYPDDSWAALANLIEPHAHSGDMSEKNLHSVIGLLRKNPAHPFLPVIALERLLSRGLRREFVRVWLALNEAWPTNTILFHCLQKLPKEIDPKTVDLSGMPRNMTPNPEVRAILPSTDELRQAILTRDEPPVGGGEDDGDCDDSFAAVEASVNHLASLLPDDLPERELHARAASVGKNPVDQVSHLRTAAILLDRLVQRELSVTEKMDIYHRVLGALDGAMAVSTPNELRCIAVLLMRLGSELKDAGMSPPPLGALRLMRLTACDQINFSVGLSSDSDSDDHGASASSSSCSSGNPCSGSNTDSVPLAGLMASTLSST